MLILITTANQNTQTDNLEVANGIIDKNVLQEKEVTVTVTNAKNKVVCKGIIIMKDYFRTYRHISQWIEDNQ